MDEHYPVRLTSEERCDLDSLSHALFDGGLSPVGMLRFKELLGLAISRLSLLEHVASHCLPEDVRRRYGAEDCGPINDGITEEEKAICAGCKHSHYIGTGTYSCEHPDHIVPLKRNYVSGQMEGGEPRLCFEFNSTGQCDKYEPITNRFLRWWRGV